MNTFIFQNKKIREWHCFTFLQISFVSNRRQLDPPACFFIQCVVLTGGYKEKLASCRHVVEQELHEPPERVPGAPRSPQTIL